MAIKNSQAGFTLIEMLVVVGIIALVSSILLFNYSDFSTNVSVRNLAQEVALSVRKAQTYATSVRTIDGYAGGNSSSFPGYGISFAVSSSAPVTMTTPGPRQFILYADTSVSPTQPIYDAGTSCGLPAAGNECLENISITTADKVDSICVNNGSKCYAADAEVDIAFRRPSPDATICLRVVGGVLDCSISNATIDLVSAKGLKRSVEVWSTGQISVQ